MTEPLTKMVLSALHLLHGTSVWLVVSFFLAGVLHNIITPDRMQRMLGNRKFSSIVKAAFSGMFLPICSCGVIPLGLGLYYSGAYLGPTLAFMTATPILNPAVLLLTYGFLGPEIAAIYFVTGIIVSLVSGVVGNWLAGEEIHAPGMDGTVEPVTLITAEKVPFSAKIRAGLEWGFKDMGAMVSKYVCYGLLLVGIILTLVPQEYIQQYLGTPGLISVVGIAALGAIMYVCAVGHIPELMSIGKLIGRRAACIYMVVLTGLSIVAGYIANIILLPDFVPFFNLDKTRDVVCIANKLIIAAPEPVQYICSGIIIFLTGYSLWPQVRRVFSREASA